MITNPHQRTERAVGRQRGRSLRRAAVGTAAAVLCLVAGAGAAQAQTTAPRPAHPALPAGMPHITVLNLHNQYLAQLGHVKPGKIAGIVHPRGWHAARAAKANTAGCTTEPNCRVIWWTGPVQHNPQVFIDYWGPNWFTDPNQSNSAVYLSQLFRGLGVAPQDTWSAITAQYSDATAFPLFTGQVLRAAINDTSMPPSGATKAQLAAEANAAATQFQSEGYTINGDSQIIVATQSGACPLNFGAPSCPAPAPGQAYCAWHSAFSSNSLTNVPFINLPYLVDAGEGCGENFVNSGSAGTDDGFSMIGGHEYAETITDPVPETGWIDLNDNVSGGEIADKCVWGGHNWGGNDPYGNVTLSTGTFAMQSLWSNTADACVMAATDEDTVTITNPGTLTTAAGGTPVDQQMTGSSSRLLPLQWYATGLPPGLSISSSGLITGTATTAGTYPVTLFTGDLTGATTSASFTWTVVPDTVTVTNPGNQTSYAQAQAKVQFSGSSSAGFTPLTWGGTVPAGATIKSSGPTTGVIGGAPYNPGTMTVTPTATDADGISGSASFTWTIKPDVGKQLKETSAKRCLNDNKSMATAGNAVNVWRCQPPTSILGLGAQDWSFSKGELKVFGLCLSDPKSGGTGTKLALAKCTSASSEHWTHKSSGEYVLKLNSLCLTDPNDSTKNGTQATITKCTAATSQQWALP